MQAAHLPRPRFAAATTLRLLMLPAIFLLLTGLSAAQTWTLSWSDEFDGAANTPINSANWQYDTGILNVNNEVEYYCAPSSSTSPCVATTPNAYIDGNGHLVIQALKINSGVAPYSASWTSARLNTGNNLQNFQYGRLESSMSLPIGSGLWPAFWALGNNIGIVGWPASGEIDFMENVPASGGLGPNAIRSTIHGGNSSSNCYCGANGLGQSYTFPSNDQNGPDVTTFHSYGAIWSTNMVQFYVDDPSNIFLVRTTSDVPSGFTWDFNHPFFLLLNLAVGGTGSWPGPPDNTTPNPAVMTVDYIRWYKPSAVAGPTMTAAPLTLKSGASGNTTVSLTSTSGSGRVYLSCSTNAPSSSCSINSANALNQYTVDFSNSAIGSATVNVTTAASASILPNYPGFDRRPFLSIAFPLLGLAFACLIFLPAKWNRNLRHGYGGAGLMLALLIPGCGAGNSSSNTGTGAGTLPANYTVTVNAYTVSNSSGNPDSTLNIPLTIN
jgi:beta-glucanase (GH16 family)